MYYSLSSSRQCYSSIKYVLYTRKLKKSNFIFYSFKYLVVLAFLEHFLLFLSKFYLVSFKFVNFQCILIQHLNLQTKLNWQQMAPFFLANLIASSIGKLKLVVCVISLSTKLTGLSYNNSRALATSAQSTQTDTSKRSIRVLLTGLDTLTQL